jgi:hypothetical protein
VAAARARQWGHAREAERERERERRSGRGLAWLGDPRVAFIGAGEDTRGVAGERKGCHQWQPV